jgi:hypothetical protein
VRGFCLTPRYIGDPGTGYVKTLDKILQVLNNASAYMSIERRPNDFQPQPEGQGSRGFSNPQAEQAPQGEISNNPERQPLPSVWDILERDVRLQERYDENRLTSQYKSVFDLYTSQEHEEYKRELAEVNRLKSDLYGKGTARDKLILDVYSAVTLEPSGLPVLIPYNRSLSREEFQQFCSKVESMSEGQLAEEIHKAKEDFERREATHSGRRPPPPDSIISV